jgi:stage IV sporulation protein FA
MDVRRNVRRRRKERMARLADAVNAALAEGLAGEDGGDHEEANAGGHAGGNGPGPAPQSRPPAARTVIGAKPSADAAGKPGDSGNEDVRSVDETRPDRDFGSGREAGFPWKARPPEMIHDAPYTDDPEKWWKERMKRRERESDSQASGGRFRFFRGLAVRSAWALAMFGAVWGWLNFELPGAAAVRFWLSAALAEELDVRSVRAWYETHFAGSPAFVPQLGDGETESAKTIWSQVETSLPVDGRVLQTFSEKGGGVRFAAPAASPVRAVYAGLVMQVAGNDGGTATVLIRHPNRVVTVYGNVAEPVVRPGDWVETGQTIGRLASGGNGSEETYLDFAVRQNGKPLDPAAVIPLD